MPMTVHGIIASTGEKRGTIAAIIIEWAAMAALRSTWQSIWRVYLLLDTQFIVTLDRFTMNRPLFIARYRHKELRSNPNPIQRTVIIKQGLSGPDSYVTKQ